MIAWDDLRYLRAAQQGGSLAAAARQLGVDATTVGRRIAAVERALGTRLVLHGRDGIRLTPAGARAARTAAALAEQVAALERGLGGTDARVEGLVRITSGDGVLVHVLAPALPDLLDRHPGLRVALLPATRTLDLSRGEADLAVRIYRPREPGLVARRVATLGYGLFAAPSYLARAGVPRRASDLARHALLGYHEELAGTPEMRWLARHAGGAGFRVLASTLPALLAACRAGAGIAAVATRIAGADPELVRILPGVDPPDREVWLAVHPELRTAARLVAVSDWIAGALAEPPGPAPRALRRRSPG